MGAGLCLAGCCRSGLRHLPETACQGRRITEIISVIYSLFITTKKVCFFKDKNCTKCLLSKSHSSMSSSHDIDKIAISAWKM